MDDKVLKLIDRAINEGLSYGEVESIMAFNGYDQLSIDQALSDIKKKRPEFVSDVPSTSEQVDSGAFNVPTSNLESTVTSDSELVPDDLTKADFVNNREPLMNFADQQAQTAQDLNDRLKSADPDPLNFFEKSAKRIGGFVRGSSTPGGLGFGVVLGNINVEVERAEQEKELEQDIEYQKSRRDDRITANAALNDHFGFDYNLYEEDEQGILRPNPEKRKQVDDYLGGMNAQADYIRNQVGIEDAINAEATKNKLPGFIEAVYDPISAPVLSSMNFGTSTAINLYGTVMDAVGAPESYAGRAKTSIAQGRATAQLRAGLDPKDTRSFTELFQDGEIGKGSISLGLTLAEQFPQIAMTIMAPEVGLAVGGVSAGTASYMDVRNRLDMTVADKITTTVVSAASEYLFEKITMTDIRLARKALGIDEAIDIAGAGAKKTARTKALKELRKQSKMRPFVQTGEQFLSEGLEEVGVELTNGVLAYMISGEVTDPRDVLESFIIGGIMGGGTVAVPQMLASGMNGMASIANMKEFKNVSDEIQSLNAKLKDNMSEYDRQKITDRIVELGQKQRNIAAASMPIYAAMPKEAQETMRQIHKDMSTALNSYYSLSDADAKKNQLNVIRNLIKDKNVMEEEYAGRAITAQEHSPKNIKINEEYTEELNDSVEYEDGQVKAENGITKSEASAMSRIFGIVKGKGKAKVVVHNSLRSLMNSDSQARELFRKSKGKTRGVAYVKTEKGGKKTIHVLSPQAFRLYNQHAGTDRSAGKTYAHEVLHTAISEMLTTDPLAQERLFAEIEKEAAAGNVFAREALKFSEKYTDEKGFDENTRKNETLTEFLALMTRGNNLESLRRDTPKLLDRIKNLINDFLISAGYTDIKIQDDADLFTVAKNLSDAMRLGSTVQFGRDIQQDKVAKAKAKRAKAEPTTTEAPVPLAADIDTEKTIDDVMFTLFNDSYEDTQRIEELNKLVKDVFESDQQVAKVVRKTIDDESTPIDAIRFIETSDAIEIRERIEEQRDYVQRMFDQIDPDTQDIDLVNTVADALQIYFETIQGLIIENESVMSSLVYDESELTLAVRDFYRNSEDALGIDFRYADAVDYYPPNNVNGYLGMMQSLIPVYGSVINEVSFDDFRDLTHGEMESTLLSADYGILTYGRKIEESFNRAIDLKLANQSQNAAQDVGFEDLVSEVREFINPLLSEIVDSESTVESFDDAFDIIDTVVRAVASGQTRIIYNIPTFNNHIVYFGEGTITIKNKSGDTRTLINLEDLAKAFKGIKDLVAAEPQKVAFQPSGRGVKETDLFTKVLYTALVELKTEGAFEGLSNIGSLALKTFTLIPNQDQGIRTVSLLPPTHDMFDEEFNLNSALAESLNPDNVKMTKATPDQWMAYFGKNKSSSQEAEFINVRAWLDNRYKETGKTIPLAEVQEYVKDNLVSPKVFTPAGHYMWSKAKYNKETGEVTVPVKSYLDEVLTPKQRLESAQERLVERPSYIGQTPTERVYEEEVIPKLNDFIEPLNDELAVVIGEQLGYTSDDVFRKVTITNLQNPNTDGQPLFGILYEEFSEEGGTSLEADRMEDVSLYDIGWYLGYATANYQNQEAYYDEENGILHRQSLDSTVTTDDLRYPAFLNRFQNQATADTENLDFLSREEANGVLQEFIAANGNPFYSAIGAQATLRQHFEPGVLPNGEFDYDNYDFFNEDDFDDQSSSVEIFEDSRGELGVRVNYTSIVYPDTRGDALNFNGSVDFTFADFASFLQEAITSPIFGHGRDSRVSYDASIGELSYTTDDGMYHISDSFYNALTAPNTSETEYEKTFERNYAYKTLRVDQGLTENQAISQALVTYGTRGQKTLGKFGTYSLANKGQDKKPVIINYTEVLVNIPNTLTNKQNRGPYVNSSHFDVENVVVHLRVGEASTADGKRVLFIDEIQSDWGQAARQRGQGMNPFDSAQADEQKIKQALQGVFDLNELYSMGLLKITRDIQDALKSGSSLSVQLGSDLWLNSFIESSLSFGGLANFDLYSLGYAFLTDIDQRAEIINEIHPGWMSSAPEILQKNEDALKEITDLLYPLRKFGDTRKALTEDPLMESEYWGATGIEARMKRVNDIIVERLTETQQSVLEYISQFGTPPLYQSYQGLGAMAIDQITSEINRYIFEPINKSMQDTLAESIIQAESAAVDALTSSGRTLKEGLGIFNSDAKSGNGVPYNPWNQNNRWVNMGIRVATKMAVDGGFDYVAWTPGDIQSKRYGTQPGLEAFYNNALPSITKNEIKRFDKKSKPGVLKIRNRINDITSGSFDVLGYPITDKIKDEFSEGTSSFTLDEDYGAGIPNEIKANPVSILNALSFADQSEISTNIEFKEGLTKMVHESPNREEIIKKYGLTLSKGPDGLMHYEMNQGLMNYLIDSFELETLVAIKAYPDAIGWYDETVTKAMTVVELMYPEIKNDSDKAAIMKMAIAITSNGLKVKQNFALAVKQYEYFRENGKFNENLAEGTQGGAMTTTFKFINKALDVMSIENFVTFLTTPVKNGDMFYYKVDSKGKKSKHNLTGNYPADYELFGAAVFGPKIGNGFFMNLMGEFQTLTIDRWLTRQFGRLRGDLLIGRNIANTKKADIRFKRAVKALGKRERNKLSFLNNDLSDTTVKMTGRDGEINWNTIASEISSAATKGSNLDILQSNPKLQELRKAANGLTKYLGGEKEAPSTGRERVFMEDIFRGVQQNLMTKYGISITVADLQAVNWYPEKALYQTFQAKNSISSAKDFTSEEEKPDYFSGASEVAREKGIKQKDIDNAIEQLDFRHESIREAVRNGNEQLGTTDQEADLEGVRKAINQVRAGQEVTSTFFHLDEEFNNYSLGSRLGDVEYSSMQPHVVQAKTYLERRMNENPVMELEGPKVIRHPGDIAFLLRHMESESSESTFLVVRDRNNPENYDVTYMTTGTVNSASVDPLKVRQIVTDFQEIYGVDVDAEVTLVHNHPSGSLRASDADLQMHKRLLEVFDKEPNVRVGNSVIINLDSGKYVEFDKGQLGASQTFQSDFTTLQKYAKQTGFKNVKVQNFNRQELFRPRTAEKLQIRGSNYVPRFLSHFKVSDTTKLGYIAMNQANEITRIVVLDAAASAEDIGLMIERTTGKYGNNIILFGNDKPALKALATASYQGLKAQTVNLLDVVHIEPGGRYKSGSDTGEMPGMGRFKTNFTLEEVAEESPKEAMSIQESLAVTEMQAEQSPLYRERDIDLPNIDEINDVIQGHKAGKKILDENAPLSPGDLVGGRLNLNLLDAGQKKYGYRMSILSVHKPSNQKGKKYQEHNGVTTLAREKVVRNVDVMTLRNAYFNVNVKGSSEVGAMLHNRFVKKLDPKQIKELYPTAKNKFPLASVDGEYVDTPRENTNFDGVMIKYNPMASHMFMDVTGRPIKFAEEVTLIGDRAYARGKIEYAETAWDLHTVPGMGVEGFVVPTRVTTDPAKIEATHNQMMESGLQFSIDESGHESHNILNDQVLNMRRTAQRFANSLGDSEADVRKKIFDNPKNYINQQNLEAIKGNLEEMSDEDLIMIMTDNALVNLSLNPENGNDNIYVLAAIERINRMQANGEDTADAIEALAKVGTTVGRMLRHFAELKTSTPIGIVQMIESAMGKAGRRMTNAQRQNLMKIAQEFMDAQRALIDHQANFGTMDSAEFTKEFTKLSKALDNVTRTLNKITATLIPKRYSNLFGTFIKGNLMTPVSLVTNVVANIFEQGRFLIQRPIEGAIHFLSFKASRLVSKYLGKDVGVKEYYGREAGVTLLALPYAMKQGALGFAESIKGMFVKQGETQKIVHTGINPMFAMFAAVSDTKLGDYLKKVFKMDLINTDVLPRTKEGKVKPGDRVKLIIEGMFGIAPDIVFRALSVGDLPFSRFSGAFVVYNEAIKKFGRAAIDTDEFQNFLKYPPQDVVAKMSREGQRATFQEKNKASDAILQFRKIVEGKGTIPGRMMGFLFDSFMPYVKTPANIFVSTMKIAMPGVGAMSAMYNYSQGNHKKGNEDLSMAIVGTMMIKAADLLIAAGAIIGAFTDEDKEEKSLQYAYTGGPMRVNQTAIRRYLLSFNEEDLQFQEGDNWMKIDKSGIIGVVMGARATATKGLDHTAKSKKNIWYAPGEDSLFDTQFMINYLNPAMMTGTFKFINSMSFLQGANSLLSLIAGDEEGYEMQRNIDNWFRSVTSVALPNTISALNRANRSHMPIFRNKDIARRMQYILLDKTFNVEGYPSRVDMVGRDILQTPEGKNPYYYHMFSVLKGQEVDPHPVIREYHRLMTATGDGSWLPSAPSKLTSYYYSPTKTDLGSETYNEIVSMLGPGEKVKMRFEEKDLTRIQKMYYQDLTKNVESLMATDSYAEAQDDRKVELIQGVIADTRKMQYVVSRDRIFGSVKFKNEWYKEFLKLTVEGAKGLKEQLKESEE